MRGVLLYASGHPYYTHMAYNLAVSIRLNSDLPIVLLHDNAGVSQLFEDQKKIFNLVGINTDLLIEGGVRQNIKGKMFLYDLSPFDETIFLDADMLMCPGKKIDDLFEQESDLQFACRGEKTMDENLKSEWVNLKEIKNLFGFEHWYDLSSEFIYFKKSEAVKRFFDDAKHYYSNHGMGIKKWIGDKLEEKENCIMEFAGGIPDEVPFCLSLEKNKVKIKAPYTPIYWQPQFFTKFMPEHEIKQKYFAISTGGAAVQENIKRIYNSLTRNYFGRMGIDRVPYQLIPKSTILKERRKI